ncbi:MAG: hypothetical protein EA394_01170 [Bacteroidia bacterium]|nr:MAG: hypothetical protein EA394_01170 [Bacteroidia bacterium]
MAPQGDEVLLVFNYRGVGGVYVTGFYDYSVDKMFLPILELFDLLQIYYEPSPGDFTLTGTYLSPDQPFRIMVTQQQVFLKGNVYVFDADDFRIGEMDFFASPRVFEEVFGLFFTINLNQLSLALETDHTLPVEKAAERARLRQMIESRDVNRILYPLVYDRDRRIAGIGFADYNISGGFSADNPSVSFNIIGGAELLGGDIQGSLVGSWSGHAHLLRASNLRWRYVVRDNPRFSTFQAGQMSTTGIQPRSIRGVSVSNDPVEPRRIFESYVVDGTTEPDSEVELYLNNRLIDFQRANEIGYYRFEFPLTYGTTQLVINIFTPSGEALQIDRRIQIPFTFLPPGEVAYNIQGGQTEVFLGEGEKEKWLIHGDVAYGITEWLTAKAGTEYIQRITEDRPFFYGGLSARVMSQYLLNLDIAPDGFYRGIASVMYPTGRSINLQYTYYQDNPFYSMGGAEQDAQITFFSPFTLFRIPMGVRIGADHQMLGNSSATRYRADLSMRVGRMNIRGNYRDALFLFEDDYVFGRGLLTGSLTYTFMRSPGLPVFVRGMFLRGNVSYSIPESAMEDISLQMTRSLRQWGRVNLDVSYDFRNEQTQMRLGLIMDLASFRSTTNLDLRNDRAVIRQNLRGSLGFDRNPDRVVASNRNQVGRSGASVILFVDNNNSGTFDEGDEIIPYRAIRLDRSAQIFVGRDGIVRINQLQSYFRYNMEVVRQALPNPLLAPGKDNFSFVADPNRYKRIEIPFYRTGVIDGTVFMIRDDERRPQGGLRLIINGLDNEFRETVRNFSDGSYYAMDMPPGKYSIEIDPTQLDFLDAYMPGGAIVFEIQALAEGDFLENFDIHIVARPPGDDKPETLTKADIAAIEEVISVVLRKRKEIETGDGFSVEAGIYTTPYHAGRVRNLLSNQFGIQFHIRHHEVYHLYVVFSEGVKNIDDAEGILEELSAGGFNLATVARFSKNWLRRIVE